MKSLKKMLKSKRLLPLLMVVCMIATLIPLTGIGVSAVDTVTTIQGLYVGAVVSATQPFSDASSKNRMYVYAGESIPTSVTQLNDYHSLKLIYTNNNNGTLGTSLSWGTDPPITTSSGYWIIKAVNRDSGGQITFIGIEEYIPGYNISLTAGTGMTCTSGSQSQNSVGSSGMSAVTYTANDGYYFPSYSYTNNGLTAVRISDTQIQVTGAPSIETTWTLPAATPRQYTVHFHGKGNTGGSTDDQTMTFNSSTSLRANGFTRTGYTFRGWDTASGGNNIIYDNGHTGLINLVTPTASNPNPVFNLYAVWGRIRYTLGYTLNGGTATNQPEYYIDTATFTLNNPNRTGYTFYGWGGTDLTGTANKTVTITEGSTGNRTYTAYWTADTYTVIYDANGGTLSGASSGTVTFDSTYGAAGSNMPATSAVTKDDAYFAGWYTAASGGSQVVGTTKINTTGDRTLHAQWIADPADLKTAADTLIDGLTDLTDEQAEGYKLQISYLVNNAKTSMSTKSGTGTTALTAVRTQLSTDIKDITDAAALQNEKNKACTELDEFVADIKEDISVLNLTEDEETEFIAMFDRSLPMVKDGQGPVQGINQQTSIANVNQLFQSYKDEFTAFKKSAEFVSYGNDSTDDLKEYADTEKAKIAKYALTEEQAAEFEQLIDDAVTTGNNAVKGVALIIGSNLSELDASILTATGQIDTAIENAKAAIDAIMSDVKVKNVQNLIEDIDPVVCTNACKAKIQGARDAYDALTADQMSDVTDPIYKLLTDAEAKMAELEKLKGKATTDAVITGKAPKAELADDPADLLSKVLDSADMDLVNHGQAVNIYIEVTDATGVTEADKKAVEKKLDNNTVGVYIDISLWKQIGSEDAEQVTKTDGKIKVTITIPEELLAKNGVDRTYQIIRVHNGVATIIDGVYDKANHTFTFETDEFSTYAVVYTDKEKAANTEDTTSIASTVVLAVVAASGAWVTMRKRREDK